MTTGLDRIVVVGASAAGLSKVEALRRGGFHGELTLVGDEPHLPYDRPPLSKQLLAGEWELERLTLRAPEAFDDLGVRTVLGSPAEKLDTGGREVLLADGSRLGYDALVAATGVRARTVPESTASKACTCRGRWMTRRRCADRSTIVGSW